MQNQEFDVRSWQTARAAFLIGMWGGCLAILAAAVLRGLDAPRVAWLSCDVAGGLQWLMAILVRRLRLTVEVRGGSVVVRKTGLVKTRCYEIARADLHAVRLTAQVQTPWLRQVRQMHQGQPIVVHAVELFAGDGGDRLPPAGRRLFTFASERTARMRAAEVARLLSVPCVDATGDTLELLREGGDASLPTERQSFSEPPPAALVVLADEVGTARCGWRDGNIATPSVLALLVGVVVLWGVILVASPQHARRAVAAAAAVVTAGIVVMLVVGALRSRRWVWVEAGMLHTCLQLPGGLRIGHRAVSVQSVTAVMTRGGASDRQHVQRGVVVLGPRRPWLLPLRRQEARLWVRAWLEAQMWPHLPVAAKPSINAPEF